MFYDRDGIPISAEGWEHLHSRPSYIRVARTHIMDAGDPSAPAVEISTVWLGFDHGFGGPLPIIFETMIFRDNSEENQECARYSSETEAREGHMTLVVQASLSMEDPVVMDVSGYDEEGQAGSCS